MSIQIEELAQLLSQAQLDKDIYNKIIISAEQLEEEKKQEERRTRLRRVRMNLLS